MKTKSSCLKSKLIASICFLILLFSFTSGLGYAQIDNRGLNYSDTTLNISKAKPIQLYSRNDKEIFNTGLKNLHVSGTTLSKLQRSGILTFQDYRKALALNPKKLNSLDDSEKAKLKEAFLQF